MRESESQAVGSKEFNLSVQVIADDIRATRAAKNTNSQDVLSPSPHIHKTTPYFVYTSRTGLGKIGLALHN